MPVFAKDYIVKVNNKRSFEASAAAIAAIKDVKVKDVHQAGRLMSVSIRNNSTKAEVEKIAQLFKRPDIEYVVENIRFHAIGSPNDPQLPKQWSLEKVNASAAWDLTTGNRQVVVAVIDTGVDVAHEDLKANIWKNSKEIPNNRIDDDRNGYVDDVNGWDFFDNDNTPNDATSAQNPGHGTHCSGIVGAVGNNGVGISGMSQLVSILPLRFLGADGSGDLYASTKAIDYAVANGAQIISASWGAEVPEATAQPIVEAIARANEKGVLFVAAASNDGASNDVKSMYPANAAVANVISVAASDANDGKPYWSNFGKRKVHLASPGDNILSTLPSNKYGPLSGTSMATPLVAGLSALLKSADFELTPQQIRSVLQTTGAKTSIETACNCRVDAKSALDAVVNKKLTVVPASATLKVGDSLSFSAYGGSGDYKFSVQSGSGSTISQDGQLTSSAEGEVVVHVEDATGQSADSLTVYVGGQSSAPPSACPFEDQMWCLIFCGIKPELPWCQGLVPPAPPGA